MSDSAYNVGSATTDSGGDLTGQYPNPTVVDIQGREVADVAPATGQVLKWDGTKWVPANPY